MAPRRKAQRLEAPSTIEQATALLADYMHLGAQVDEVRADAQSAILQIEAHRDTIIAPAEQQQKAMFVQLRTWWAVAAPALTEGKRKSIELAGAVIGERTPPPSLKLPRGMNVETAIGFLRTLAKTWPAAAQHLRVTFALEKPSLIKLLRNHADPGPIRAAIVAEGFTIRQDDEFFIDRAATREASPDTIAEPPTAITQAPDKSAPTPAQEQSS